MLLLVQVSCSTASAPPPPGDSVLLTPTLGPDLDTHTRFSCRGCYRAAHHQLSKEKGETGMQRRQRTPSPSGDDERQGGHGAQSAPAVIYVPVSP